jgi:transposase-like protein
MSKQTRTRGEDYEAPVPVPKAKRTRGRPSEFEPEYVAEAAELARSGATDKEIAAELGVAMSTLSRWFLAYPQLREAVKAAKEQIDQRVVRSLYKRAVEDGDTTAHIFWLKNRQPELWRDRKETEIIVPPSDEEAAQLDSRSAALAALALFNEAQYDPTAAGILLEATANAEENDDGEAQPARATGAARGDQVEADDDWDEPSGYDLDPGEL